MNYQGKKFLSLPEQVQVNKRNIEQLKRDEYRTFTTLLAIENLTYLELNQLVENSRDVSVGDLIYGSDAYYGQVTRVGGSVVEFTTVGLMPAGPKGDQGNQGPIGLTGPQGEQGIPGEVQIKDLPHVNLFDKNSTVNVRYGAIETILDTGFKIKSISAGSGQAVVYSIKLKKQTNYTIQADINVISGESRIWVKPALSTSAMYLDNSGSITFPSGEYEDYLLYFYSTLGPTNVVGEVDYTNIQLEEGSRATPYIASGQVPIYANQEQEPWITPTLLGGATGTIQYMKDTLGFVHFRGRVNKPMGIATAFMSMPVGYRVNEQYLLPLWDDVRNKVGILIIYSEGAFYVGSDLDGSEFNGTLLNITYQGV